MAEDIMNMFRIKSGENEGKFKDLNNLPSPDTVIIDSIPVFQSM